MSEDLADDKLVLGRLSGLVGYHMRRAAQAFSSDFASAVAGTGMRQILIGILSTIDANPGVQQGVVARALGVQRANMVALVNELEKAGLIERRVSEQDKRALELTVTDEGRQALRNVLEAIEAHESRMLSGFSNAERALLIEMLERIQANER